MAGAWAGPALVHVTSDPPEATVYIRQARFPEGEDKLRGRAPLDLSVSNVTSLERDFVLTVKLKGYHPDIRTLSLWTGAEKTVDVRLVPLDQPAPAPAEPDTTARPDRPEDDTGAETMEQEPSSPLTEADATNAVAPAGFEVAFIRSGGLYLAHADGSAEQRVADVGRSGSRAAPAWSPDGTKVAYIDRGNLFIVGEDGAAKRILRAGDLSPSKTYWRGLTPRLDGPSFRPDGSQIAFLHYTRDGFANAYVAGADGSRPTMVAELADGPPEWHPSLPLLAVPSQGSVMIYDTRTLPRPPALAVLPTADEPTWSPDGRWLAVTAGGDLWACDPLGRDRHRVFHRDGYAARRSRWLSSSRKLAAVVQVRKALGIRRDEIWAIPLERGEPRAVVGPDSLPEGGVTIDLAGVSADGASLIYGVGRSPTVYYSVPVEGGESRVLLDNAERPAWIWRKQTAPTAMD